MSTFEHFSLSLEEGLIRLQRRSEALEQFLSSFEAGLIRLQRRTEAVEQSLLSFEASLERPPVRYQPNAGQAGANEVQIGVGRFAVPSTGEIGEGGVCLNNKAAAALEMATELSSVTDLVLNAPDPIFEAWRRTVADDYPPERFFDRFTLVVEDASPDSCFGLFCLLLRLADIPTDAIPRGWIEYVRQWEKGVVLGNGGPSETYGCLHNALVHRTIEHNKARSWLDGLRLLCDALGSGQPPQALPATLSTPQIDMARAFLSFEEQAYRESLDHADCIQLSLPMVGTKGRLLLVDAYLAEETIPFGSLKVFAHNDRDRSSLKAGYALLAIYRSIAKGDGFDVTISVDPRAGVELEELWRKLEEKEDDNWGGERPCDDPRPDIRRYPGGTRADGRNAPNEPWYDGRDYTLLAAPRRLKDGRFGSKLTWTEVREALWEVYQPFRDLKVMPGADAGTDPVPLEECPPEPLPGAPPLKVPRHLFFARWHHAASAFRVTATLSRYLAACISRCPAQRGTPIRLDELPDEASCSRVELPGGIAVITEKGAFVLDGGRHHSVKFAPLKNEFRTALPILKRLETNEKKTRVLLSDTDKYIHGEGGPELSLKDLLDRLSLEQIELGHERHQARTTHVNPEARLFGEALLARWGIAGWLDSISGDVKRISDALHSRTERLNSTRIAQLSAAALPLLFTIPLVAIIAEHPKLIGFYANDQTVETTSIIIAVALVLNCLLFWAFYKLISRLDRPPPGSHPDPNGSP